MIIKKPIENIFKKNRKIKEKVLEKKKIIVDYRERNSFLPLLLKKINFEVEFKELKIGDYIIQDVVIERKTVSDFVSSMINRRLIKQLEDLQKYPKRLLMIEGIDEQELYNDCWEKGINSNAIRGFLLSILLKYKVPIIYTKNSEDSAKFMRILSEKKEKSQEISLNVSKKDMSKKERLEFIIQSFPGIGPKKSKELLEKFGTLQNIINAPKEDLKKVLGKKAEIVLDIINMKYL